LKLSFDRDYCQLIIVRSAFNISIQNFAKFRQSSTDVCIAFLIHLQFNLKIKTTNRKWPTGNQMVMWPITSHDHVTYWVIVPNTLRAQYLENSWRCYLANRGSTVGYSLPSCM